MTRRHRIGTATRVCWSLRSVLAALFGAACSPVMPAPSATGAAPAFVASPWPAAERLFRSDPDWRGGDAAYAIPLADERTLWLFGDSFVARQPGATRRSDCAMVRNSIGVMTGADPATAHLAFHWRRGPQGPADWWPGDGGTWLWPLHGCCDGDTLVVFCTRLEAAGDGPFGFRAVGWTALRRGGVRGDVVAWRELPVRLPTLPNGLVVGTAVVEVDDHVAVYALREPGDHAVFLLRWPRRALFAGDLGTPEWWDHGSWSPAQPAGPWPTPVLAEGAPEFTVTRAGGGFAMWQSRDFFSGDLAVRTAPSAAGPWSSPTVLLRPPQSGVAGLFVYAGKALPLADGTWLLTCASNASDWSRLVADEAIYFPHCYRGRIDPHPSR